VKYEVKSVIDELHLSGGIRAGTNEDGQLVIYPTVDMVGAVFSITNKEKYFSFFQSMGLNLIGHETTMDDNVLSHVDWHPFMPSSLNAADEWSQISYGAKQTKNESASDLAHYIAFSLRTAALRLRDVSREYGKQQIYATSKKLSPNGHFSNTNIFDLYMALHSFLVEICSARDYLASFISSYIIKDIKRVDSMAKLLEELKKRQSNHELAQLILQICDPENENGWMAQLTKFRNLIAHQAPINNHTENKWLTAHSLKAGQKQFLSIYLGVPKNPLKPENKIYIDALEGFYGFMVQMQIFAQNVAEQSGIEPQVMHLTEADLI
jgi:hypothetical protein